MATGRKTGGRRKGTPNKTTASVKAAFEEAFDRMGGVDALVSWAASDPGEFFKLYSKLLPIQLRADLNHNGLDGLADRLERAQQRTSQEDRQRRAAPTPVAHPVHAVIEPEPQPEPQPTPPRKPAPAKPKPKPTPYQPISHLPEPLPYGGATMDPDYTPLKD